MTMKASIKMKKHIPTSISTKTLYELCEAMRASLDARHYLSAESYARAIYNLCFDFDNLKDYMREAHSIDTCVMMHDYDGARKVAQNLMHLISNEIMSDVLL